MQRPDNNPKSAHGVKKPPLGLIPKAALEHCAGAMKIGAEKYGAWNWRDEDVAASVYIDAAIRHLKAWQEAEDDDPESGVSHLGHVMACCAILLDAQSVEKLIDDRPIADRKHSRRPEPGEYVVASTPFYADPNHTVYVEDAE